MPETHAKLSPSAADRWMCCPGSVVLCEGMPEKSSPYAAEGTRAHAVAAALLTRSSVPEHPPEMLPHVMTYVNAVRDLAQVEAHRVHPPILHVEVEVEVNYVIWGTADGIVWDPLTKTLYVRDLKYGAGVGVEVQGNKQLKIYALAALLTMKYPAKIVNVGIIQPRFGHPDGPSRSVDFDAVDLMDFHADLVVAYKNVELASIATTQGRQDPTWINTYLIPSEKGCRFCLAAPVCPKLKAMAKDEAKEVFAKGAPYDPAELAKTLDNLPILEGWIKNVREFAYSQAEEGKVIPDYKLVEKRAIRKWKDEAFASAKLFDAGFKDICYTEPELLTPAALEKVLPKDQRSILDDLTVKESSGHTLVHTSDKREAVRIDAKSVFE